MTTDSQLRAHRLRGVEIMAHLKGACPAKTDRGRKELVAAGTTDYAPSKRPIKETITEGEEWWRELTELVEPFADAVAMRFEPLGIIQPEELAGLEGLVPLSLEHKEALKCHNVRMYRLELLIARRWPKKITKKTGQKAKNVGRQIDEARMLRSVGEATSDRMAAKMAVEKFGRGNCASDDAAIDYVRKRMSYLPSGVGSKG